MRVRMRVRVRVRVGTRFELAPRACASMMCWFIVLMYVS